MDLTHIKSTVTEVVDSEEYQYELSTQYIFQTGPHFTKFFFSVMRENAVTSSCETGCEGR